MSRTLKRMDRNLKVIYAAAFFRSLGVGLTGVLLGVYLSRAGFSESQLGVVIAAGLGGAAAGTAVVSFAADRLGRRRTLIVLSVLGALGFIAVLGAVGSSAVGLHRPAVAQRVQRL